MKGRKVVLGEFEDELYAEVARRELISAGIRANILKERTGKSSPVMLCTERVKLIVIDTQLEEARKVLATKFI
jgi:hypothetical protein